MTKTLFWKILNMFDWQKQGNDDLFLYQRCTALINGKKFYAAVLFGLKNLNPDLEFESLLYVPKSAWAKKHHQNAAKYPHLAVPSYETGSNKAKW